MPELRWTIRNWNSFGKVPFLWNYSHCASMRLMTSCGVIFPLEIFVLFCQSLSEKLYLTLFINLHTRVGELQNLWYVENMYGRYIKVGENLVDIYRYVLTIIDRFTLGPEPIPLKHITSESVADALLARVTPTSVTIDQGLQLESAVFQGPIAMLRCRKSTSPYYPSANGLLQKWHRTLKSSL